MKKNQIKANVKSQIEVAAVKSQKNEPSVKIDEKGQITVSEELKEAAREATEPKAHKKYNKNQSLRIFEYKVYYGDASHEDGNHGALQKDFKNLQTAINWIAKEAKFYIEEGIERENFSIVLNDMLIAEY